MNIKIERPKDEEPNSLSVSFCIQFDSEPENVERAFNKVLTFMQENMPREEFEDIAREMLAKIQEHQRENMTHG